jgi:hypothetical protein
MWRPDYTEVENQLDGGIEPLGWYAYWDAEDGGVVGPRFARAKDCNVLCRMLDSRRLTEDDVFAMADDEWKRFQYEALSQLAW